MSQYAGHGEHTYIFLHCSTHWTKTLCSAYDDLDYYADGRQLSIAAPGFGTPYSGRRRASSMSHRSRHPMDSHRRWSSTLIKFKRKGGLRSGISLGEAMSNVRLSGNDSYSFYDLNVDHRGRILLKIRVSPTRTPYTLYVTDSWIIVDWIFSNDI